MLQDCFASSYGSHWSEELWFLTWNQFSSATTNSHPMENVLVEASWLKINHTDKGAVLLLCLHLGVSFSYTHIDLAIPMLSCQCWASARDKLAQKLSLLGSVAVPGASQLGLLLSFLHHRCRLQGKIFPSVLFLLLGVLTPFLVHCCCWPANKLASVQRWIWMQKSSIQQKRRCQWTSCIVTGYEKLLDSTASLFSIAYPISSSRGKAVFTFQSQVHVTLAHVLISSLHCHSWYFIPHSFITSLGLSAIFYLFSS